MKRKNVKDNMVKAAASTNKVGNVIVLNRDKDETTEILRTVERGKNLALNKSTESSDIEKDNLGANNITSGIVDREKLKNRWSSVYDAEKPWVTINLGRKTKFNEVVIEWERRNVTSYEIQGSNDNEDWTIIKELGRPKEIRQAIEFEEQQFKYLKLQINTYSEDGVLGEIPWSNVSIYEVEVYHNKHVGAPKDIVQEDIKVANKVKEKTVDGVLSKDQDVKANLGKAKAIDDKVDKKRKDCKRSKVKIADKKVSKERVCAGSKSPPH